MISTLLSPALVFLGKMTLISAFLYGYYWFFLRNASFHPYNRWYLLGSIGLSLFLPLLHIPLPAGWMSGEHYTLLLSPNQAANGGSTADPAPALLSGPPPGLFYGLFRGWKGIYLFYGLVAGFFLFRLVHSLWYLLRLPGKYTCTRVEDIRLFRTQEPDTPFSFFNYLFWNAELPLDTDRGQAIFRHEQYHIRQKHTLDILVLAIVRSLFWFNPFFHWLLRELKVVHEFLADRYVLAGSDGRVGEPPAGGQQASKAPDRRDYAEWLVWMSVHGDSRRLQVAHSFFNTHLKRRINMIIQSNQGRPRFISRIMVLPLLFLVVCAFAARTRPSSPALSDRTIIVKDSNHLQDLVRFYMHKLRYPATALKEQQEETIWFSVRVGANNQLLEFRHYDAAPDLKDKKAWTITVKSLPSRFPDDKAGRILTQENKKLVFLEEALRASERISADTSRVYPAGEYFFTIVFSIEKTADKASSLEFRIQDNSRDNALKPKAP